MTLGSTRRQSRRWRWSRMPLTPRGDCPNSPSVRHTWGLWGIMFLVPVFLPLTPHIVCAETQIAVAGVRYALYRGNLHVHTVYSKGGGDHSHCVSPEDTCANARGCGMDVIGFSDHAERLDEQAWNHIGSVCESSHDDYTIIGLRGFEWTHESYWAVPIAEEKWNESANEHVNVFGLGIDSSPKRDGVDAPIYAREDRDRVFGTYCHDLSDLYNEISRLVSTEHRRPVCQFSHPAICVSKFDNFRLDERVLTSFALLEVWIPWNLVNVGLRSNKERWSKGEECYRVALRNGWHVAPTAGIDNQNGDFSPLAGDEKINDHYTGIWATASTSDAVLEALRNRRIFATGCEGLSLRLQAVCGGAEYLMGDAVQLRQDSEMTLRAVVDSPQPIDYVRLVEIRDGQDYRPEGTGLKPNAREPYGTNHEQLSAAVTPADATLCYYVRVRLTNGEMALSAPIWVQHDSNKEELSAPIFVLDRSGSMDAVQGQLNQQAEACVDYLMSHVSAMAVVNFNGAGTATVDAPLTKDRDRIVHAIRYPSQTSGSTAIYEAVVKAVDEAVAARQKAMIILLTDGANNSGRASLRDAIAAAQRRDVPCMTVGFCRPGSQEEADMLELAHKTAGIYYHTSNFDVRRFVQDHITFSRARRDTNPVDVAPPVF